MAAGAGRGQVVGQLLQAVAGGCLDREAAVAFDEVLGEVAAGAEDDEWFVGGSEERAE